MPLLSLFLARAGFVAPLLDLIYRARERATGKIVAFKKTRLPEDDEGVPPTLRDVSLHRSARERGHREDRSAQEHPPPRGRLIRYVSRFSYRSALIRQYSRRRSGLAANIWLRRLNHEGNRTVLGSPALACLRRGVEMPSVNSLVYYFPQGQAEHAQGNVDFGGFLWVPPYILCRVAAIKYLADSETDEVYAMMKLVPVRSDELDYAGEDGGGFGSTRSDISEKSTSFAKTLTQSDANNGGGFSVPRYCAETIFPRLDYSADPPVQTILAKDVHGEVWKFRHIYRGTPRRHLLTTGWSAFVNRKKLVAGDSIVFLRTESGELCVGIRRAKRGYGGGLESPLGWNSTSESCLHPYGGYSVFLREQENKLMGGHGGGGNPNAGGGIRGRGRVRPESVVEAANLAAKGLPFEVMYYPRASTPEFCVKAAAVRAALRIDWCPGLRFKMAFETEDSSRISWFMGTISSVQCADPIRWLNSPWRLLQVTWDEPDLLQNVKRVSPWLVELLSNVPSIHLKPFSPPRKKLRFPQPPDFPLDGQLVSPAFAGNSLEASSSFLCCLPGGTAAGIQGARHAQFGISLSDLQISKLQSGLLQSGFHQMEKSIPPSGVSTGINIGKSTIHDNVSCLLSIGNASPAEKTSIDVKMPHFLLFGQPILTEQQISQSCAETRSPAQAGKSGLNGDPDKNANLSDGSGSAINQNVPADNSSCEGFVWYKDQQATELGLETGHCKVFMESEDVGRTLDLSILGSYEELYKRLADMFGIEKSDIKSNVLYHDATGAVKHTGDEAFGDFMKTARRLRILMDAGSDNIGR